MTELTITPKISDKTARFKGTVAAGEHVAVTIKGGAAWIDNEDAGAHLSLRVLDLVTGRTLAVFPRPPETLLEGESFAEGENEWAPSEENPEDLYCELNLNTVPMVAAARHMLRVPVLFVLGEKDDENASVVRTLYFRDRHVVEFWPERIGDDTPYDLDKWPRQIDEWSQLVAGWSARLDRMNLAAVRTGDQPTGDVGYVTITLNKGTSGESDTVVKVYDGLNGQDGHDGQTTHEWVEERFLALEGGEMEGPIAFPVSGDGQSITCTQDGIIVTDGTKSYEFTASGNSTGNNTVARLSDVATKQNTLTFDSAPTANSTNPVTSGGVKTAIDAVAGDVADINDLIPSAASSSNQIADKAFVNSSIATNTANYISDNGEPFESVTALNAYSGTKTNNDYAFVVGEDSAGNKTYTRYKWDGSQWAAEYVLNNSSFTSAQWAAITSGITSSAVTKLSGIEAGAEVNVIETVKVNGTALTPSSKAVDVPIPTATQTLAQEEYSSTDKSVMVDVPSERELKLKIRNVLSNTVNTLDTSVGGTIATREWVQQNVDVPSPSDADPAANGTAWEGESDNYSRADHVHPTDPSRQAALSQTQLNNIAAVPDKLDSSVTDAYSIAVASGHLAVTDSQTNATYVFAGPVSSPDDVARGEDLPYATGVSMDESEGVYYPIDRAVNSYKAADGDTALTLNMPQPMPVDQGGRARDFIVDADNSANTRALGLEFEALGQDYALAVNKADVSATKTAGDVLAEMATVDAGERARFYFTETSQWYTPSGAQDPIPVISVQRMTIEVVTSQGGAA